MEVLREALRRVGAGKSSALVTVIRVSGSTPRHAGARMLVDADARTVGTIGGGRVEQEVTRLGARIAAGHEPAQRVVHHLVRDLAMCCGGTMELFVEPVTAVSAAVIGEALGAVDERRSVVLQTDLDGGGKALGDGPVEGAARIDGARFVEPLRPRARLILFGLGHVSRALGPVAAEVGFEIVVCDDNETGQLDALPSWVACAVASFELADVERAIGPLGRGDHLLILTRDHAVDERLVAACLPRIESVDYVGLIGSQGKIGRFRRRLVARGIATPERWERLHAPIGLDIAAETPAEIAISVVAELVALRNRAKLERP